MPWTETANGNGAGANAATTGSMVLTGATVLIAHVAYYGATALVGTDVTDSSSNTWVALTARNDPGGNVNVKGQFFYVLAPTVSGAQTVTATKAGYSLGLTVVGLQGFTATFSSESLGTTYAAGATTVQAPSIGAAGDVVIAGSNWDGAKTSVNAIDSAFSAVIERAYLAGTNEGSSMAWKEVTDATQPIWSWTGTASKGVAQNINFTSSGGGGAVGQPTTKRFGGIPHMGTTKFRGGHRGGVW